MTGKKKLAIGIVGVLFVAVLIILLLVYLGERKVTPVVEEVKEEEPLHLGEIREETRRQVEREPTIVAEPVPDHVDDEPPEISRVPEVSDYERLLEQLKSFCSYLDSREYVKEYEVPEGTYLRMLAVLDRLASAEPYIVAEATDTKRLAANLYYFYRTIGKEDALLTAAIVAREREKMEAVMDLCYNWLILDLEQDRRATALSIDSLYHYGAFFLTTLGGTSYLARRDSRTSFLVRYYSLLVVDLADRQTNNPYGIDILPHLEKLLSDMDTISDLEKRESYEATLMEIRQRLIRR